MSGWISVAITVILVVVAYLVLNRNIRTRTSQQAALDEIKREVGAIITELNSTTERNIELIEDRIASLERLIEQADKRVGALRRDLATRSGEGGTYTRLGRSSSQGPAQATTRARAESVENDGAGADAGSGETRGVQDASADGGTGREARPRGAERLSEGPPAGDASGTVRERVRRLYLQGVPMPRIAAIVGKTVGEVELFVALDEGAEE